MGCEPARAIAQVMFSELFIHHGSFLQTVFPKHTCMTAMWDYVISLHRAKINHLYHFPCPLDQLSCQGEEIRLFQHELFLSSPCGLLSYYLIILQVLINRCLTACSNIFPGTEVRLTWLYFPRFLNYSFLMAAVIRS